MFVWNYGLFENAQTLMLDTKHGVSFKSIYKLLSPPMTTGSMTFFMDDYLFFKSSLLFFQSVLVLPYYCLDITPESLEKQIWQNDQTQYRTSKFFEGIFQACYQKFHSNPFPEHHFVVSTMTT